MKYLIIVLVAAAVGACTSKQVKLIEPTKTELEVKAFLQKENNQFKKCAALSKGRGNVVLQFVVARTGRVSSVSVLENSTQDLEVPQCLTLKLNKMSTASKPDEDLVLKHRFQFG